MTALPDGDLLLRLHAREVEALEVLYDRYCGFVHAIALRLIGSREEADEVVQDVFWQLWKNGIRYDPDRGRFSTWLFAIARNRCIDRLRSRRRDFFVESLPVDLPETRHHDPEEDAALAERRRLVLDALRQLPIPQRQALELGFYQGMTHTEIAARLGEPLGTVKSRIKMGMGKLKQSLHGMGNPS